MNGCINGKILPFRMIDLNIWIISLITISIFGSMMDKRTKYRNEMLGKIKGFRNFLKTAEKDKLETLVNQDPAYFITSAILVR